ncbi:MAG: hypothetical protein ACR2PK_07005 [Acidimicrobiales bacterium]
MKPRPALREVGVVGWAVDASRRRRGQTPSPGVGVLAALEGVAFIVWNLLASPIIGRRRLRWGTVGTEATDPLPGDESVRQPRWSYTLGIAVDAPPEMVWPWIAQIGQGRGGFYSYQTLENLFGCRITNTTEILAEHQHPAVGDEIYLHPTVPPMRLRLVDPPNALVLHGSPADVSAEESWGVSTWQFAVAIRADGGSRLLTRGRFDYGADWKSRLTFGRFPIEVISFVMSRKMMLEVKRLAEAC